MLCPLRTVLALALAVGLLAGCGGTEAEPTGSSGDGAVGAPSQGAASPGGAQDGSGAARQDGTEPAVAEAEPEQQVIGGAARGDAERAPAPAGTKRSPNGQEGEPGGRAKREGSLEELSEQIERHLQRGAQRDLGDLTDEMLRKTRVEGCPDSLKGFGLCSGDR